jgi:hypothetical protein
MHPYEELSEKFFWATAVAKRNMFDIEELWDPKFRIEKHHKVATFGSCFAQHIGRALVSRNFNWMISEWPPRGLSAENAKKYNYGVFSARTGNIYTVSLLQQWVHWATGEADIPEEVWEKDGRYYDPFRPNIEPNGFLSVNELRLSRELAIEAFKECLMKANVFVFTLGLTESWFNKEHGYEYPMCPGTVAGVFDRSKHQFINQDFPFIRSRLEATIGKIHELNPGIKILLTVSPVPLTATNSGNHVLIATMESKSILRAVAGQMKRRFGFVDYFPSYEIINSPPFRGTFFESNQRTVNHVGVNHVMDSFFKCLHSKFPMLDMPKIQTKDNEKPATSSTRPELDKKAVKRDEDVICEEELLNAFAK